MSNSISVAVRVRPLSRKERSMPENKQDPLVVTRDTVAGVPFTAVFPPTAPTGQLFTEAVLPTVDQWLDGFNACVFAYGQTGSGKTHTMLGPDGGKAAAEDAAAVPGDPLPAHLNGVIPRVVAHALTRVREEEAKARSGTGAVSQFRLRATYVEVYNNDIRDLLGPSGTQRSRGGPKPRRGSVPAARRRNYGLHSDGVGAKSVRSGGPVIRETAEGEVYLDGCYFETITSASDVAELVREGSLRRATGQTNMNEHSSRSHAIFQLHLEHRWETEAGGASAYKRKLCTLNLVDLAGSEYAKKTGNQGEQLKESIAINTGLFALGNVIAALVDGGGAAAREAPASRRKPSPARRASTKEKERGHVPYRDSTLTRLLQSSLGGDSKTVMIACVSPAVSERDETLSTLHYASEGMRITNRARRHVDDVAGGLGPKDPLEGDARDPDPFFDRRVCWIRTSFGDVFARCVGHPQPSAAARQGRTAFCLNATEATGASSSDGEVSNLVLMVHGSGPTNSSTWWALLQHELAATSPRPLYTVAIDCPGYGRSAGDRQDIRSYPGALLKSIIHALGYEKALCLVGSSQGACAVFNAVLEAPSIAHHVAVMHPVGHDVFRYSAIKQPCLLAFDTEDTGHPVKVGRWMRDVLPRCAYFEFAYSKQPFWLSDHYAPEMLRMFAGTWGSSRRSAASSTPAAPPSATAVSKGAVDPRSDDSEDDECGGRIVLAGGLIGWAEHRGFGEALKAVDLNVASKPSEFLNAAAVASPPSTLPPRAVPGGGPSANRKDQDGGGMVEQESFCDAADLSPDDDDGGRPNLFRDEDGESEEAPEDVARRTADRRSTELAQIDCDACGKVLLEPRRMAACRHALCCVCFDATTNYTTTCAACGHPGDVETPPTSMTPAVDPKTLMSKPVKSIDADHFAAVVEAAGDRVAARRQEAACYFGRKSKQLRVVLEYGNTAVGDGSKVFTVEAFCRIVKVERGAKYGTNVSARDLPDPSSTPQEGQGTAVVYPMAALPSVTASSLCRVDFDINPDFPGSAVRVTQPPYTLTRTMSTAFTCAMTAHFTAAPVIPAVVIPYCIHHAPRTARRVVLCIEATAMESVPTVAATLGRQLSAASGMAEAVARDQARRGERRGSRAAATRGRVPKTIEVDHAEGAMIHFAVNVKS